MTTAAATVGPPRGPRAPRVSRASRAGGSRADMRGIHRARLVLVASAAVSLAVVVAELPVSTLVGQRSALAAASARLSAVKAENARLEGQVAELSKPSTVAAIAHADYGLVRPGQVAYAILAAKGSGNPGALAFKPVPADALLPSSVSPFGGPPASTQARTGPRPGFWAQVVDRLAFWRGAF